MFGVGGSELIVILIIALIFLGPDKLPDAAKQISKGIRDLKKQSRILQEQIENDEHIGGALRDIKSALRGDDVPVRPPVRKQPKKPAELPEGTVEAEKKAEAAEPAEPAPALDPVAEPSLIKPAEGIVAKGELEKPAEPAPAPESEAAPKHG
jgi:sec-independent protein translocase protein TatB